MTQEEAIEILMDEAGLGYHPHSYEEFECAFWMAIDAMRSQKAPVKLDRSRWEGCEMCCTQWAKADWADGGAHDFRINDDSLYCFDAQFGWEGIKIKFCPICGRPLTEESWVEMESRMSHELWICPS